MVELPPLQQRARTAWIKYRAAINQSQTLLMRALHERSQKLSAAQLSQARRVVNARVDRYA